MKLSLKAWGINMLSAQFNEIVNNHVGALDIKMFPRDMWLSQHELEVFMFRQQKERKLGKRAYYESVGIALAPKGANYRGEFDYSK